MEYLDSESFDVAPVNGSTINAAPRRNVFDLTISDLVRRSGDQHRRRSPLIINGVTHRETLREKINRETAELEDVLIAVSSKLADRRRQLKHLERFPVEDPFDDDATIMFSKTFPHTPDKSYSYVATKRNDLWYVTGDRSPNGVTWDALVDWMGLGVEKVYQLNVGKNARRKVIG